MPGRVQSVDRLVEKQDARVTEQRGGHPEPLHHSERERASPAAAGAGQPDDAEHLVHPPARDAAAGRQRGQMRPGAAARVEGPGIEESADFPERPAQVVVATAADRGSSGVRPVQAHDQPHRGGLP